MDGSLSILGTGRKFRITALWNPIKQVALFSTLILLLLMPTTAGLADDYEAGKGTRGLVPIIRLLCDHNRLSILPGEDITYNIAIEITMYEGPLNGSLWIEEVPHYWTATLNLTNFTVDVGDPIIYVSLSTFSPANASIGFEAGINVVGILANESGEVSRHTCVTITRILGPDLSLMPTGITLSNEEPIHGETIAIGVQIFNNGEINVTNVSIIIMVDDVLNWDIGIVSIIEPGSSENFSIDWLSIAGDHEITIAVDPDNTINEHSEENNNLTISISVETIPEDNGDERTSWPFVRMVIAIMMLIAIAIIIIFLKIKKMKDNKK